jgi:hypothetical protein
LWTFFKTFGATLVSAVIAAALIFRHHLTIDQRILLISLAIITLCFTGLYFLQVRWEPFALGAAVLLSAAVLSVLSAINTSKGKRMLVAALSLHLLFAIALIIQPLRQLHRVEKIDPVWLNAMLQRNLMLQIREHLQDQVPLRLMVSPEMAPAVYYFNVGDSVGSLYWENVEGLVDVSLFFASPIESVTASQGAERRAISHALIATGPSDALLFHHLETGNLSESHAAVSMAGALAQSGAPVPAWIQSNPVVNERVNPTYHTWIPKIGQSVPLHLNVWLHSIQLSN